MWPSLAYMTLTNKRISYVVENKDGQPLCKQTGQSVLHVFAMKNTTKKMHVSLHSFILQVVATVLRHVCIAACATKLQCFAESDRTFISHPRR